MRQQGKGTKYPGVYYVDEKVYRVKAKAVDPRTGKSRQVEQLVHGVSAQQASAARARLIAEIRAGGREASARARVTDFARSWLESKAAVLDGSTADLYAAVLESHVLPTFGDYFFDELRSRDVQAWVSRSLAKGFKVATVHQWFRVLRTMTRDAVESLDLARDPTRRISFPDAEERTGPNATTADKLGAFLELLKAHPHNFALTAVLAYTGLRFCHASALRWEDIDEERGVILVRRKQYRGEVGPVSRTKKAPREYPLHAELARILREHRQWMLCKQVPGFESGWCFPARRRKAKNWLRTPSTLKKTWAKCVEAAGIKGRFTVHGLRRTFNDLARRAGVDTIVTKALTGHITEEMHEHYSTVNLEEKRAAVEGVLRLVTGEGMDGGMNQVPDKETPRQPAKDNGA